MQALTLSISAAAFASSALLSSGGHRKRKITALSIFPVRRLFVSLAWPFRPTWRWCNHGATFAPDSHMDHRTAATEALTGEELLVFL
jgi:hypothetical protein